MSRPSRRSRGAARGNRPDPGRSARPTGRIPVIVGVAVALTLAVGAAAFVLLRSGGPPAAAWSRLGTDDVHSLAFVDDDPSRLLFGHHGGILSSDDGGRTWQPLATRSDAMSLGPASDGSILIAGHGVLAESRDDGQTWQDVPADLPSLDIHGFARDPADGARMWAYLATGGLWESQDTGRTWEWVQQENILFPVAIDGSSGTRLVGVTAGGLASSGDGGRTWSLLGDPGLYPVSSLAATADGSVLIAGGTAGLERSDDGGASWSKLPFKGQPFAIAVTNGGGTIVLVTRATDFFRSDDGGQTWPSQ